MSDRPINGFWAESSALDIAVDVRLSEIRALQDSGTITVREAADMRVEALERHLDALRELRNEYFGDNEVSRVDD